VLVVGEVPLSKSIRAGKAINELLKTWGLRDAASKKGRDGERPN